MRRLQLLAAVSAAALMATLLASGAGQAADAAPAVAPTAAEAPAPAAKPNVVVINPSPDAPAAPASPSEAQTTAAPDKAAAPPSPEVPADTAASEPDAAGAVKDHEPAAANDSATAEPSAEASDRDSESQQAAVPVAPPPAEPTLSIDIDLGKQMMRVAENGATKYVWPVSSGRYGYTTPTGTFKPMWMSKMWYSRQYDYAPMPYAVFFHGGAAIHGTYATGMLGRPASHGCVRLATNNAATLYKLVGKHGKGLTQIVVHGVPNHGAEPQVASRRDDRWYADDDFGYGYGRAPRYAPPRAYRWRSYAYDDMPDTYYVPRSRRSYEPQTRGRTYRQRGLFNNGYVGYGF